VAEIKWMELQYLPAYPLLSEDILDPSNTVTDTKPQQYYLSAWTYTTWDENTGSQQHDHLPLNHICPYLKQENAIPPTSHNLLACTTYNDLYFHVSFLTCLYK
jgi:hypothetical protein